MEHLLASLDADAIRSRSFRVAVDFCNGACPSVTKRFLNELGCSLLPLNEEPDGRFPHPPAPTAANMQDLAALVGDTDADLGAAINIDGDRIAFVTAEGVALSEESTLPLAAQSRLARRKGAVVTNLSTSRMIDLVAEQYGQTVLRTAVGECHVLDRGVEENAVLAGEGSGGVGSLPAAMTFDALGTLAMILEAMALKDLTLTDLVDELPRFKMKKGAVPCQPAQAYRIMDSYRAAYADQGPDLTDGVRIDWDDAWLHVRASNTEPLVRVIVEAESAERADWVFRNAMECAERMALEH